MACGCVYMYMELPGDLDGQAASAVIRAYVRRATSTVIQRRGCRAATRGRGTEEGANADDAPSAGLSGLLPPVLASKRTERCDAEANATRLSLEADAPPCRRWAIHPRVLNPWPDLVPHDSVPEGPDRVAVVGHGVRRGALGTTLCSHRPCSAMGICFATPRKEASGGSTRRRSLRTRRSSRARCSRSLSLRASSGSCVAATARPPVVAPTPRRVPGSFLGEHRRTSSPPPRRRSGVPPRT
jgi:hypothetical protein